MGDFFNIAFGIHGEELTWWQMSVRAVVVFFVALIILRIGNHRIFGKNSAFDIVLGIIYGSILSRAITGNSPFIPTLVAALVLVLLHKGLAIVAYHSSFGFGDFIKGERVKLIEDGDLMRDALKKNSVTENDLEEALRKSGTEADLSKIKSAYLERSGKISVIMKDDND
ncbi:DUF421 domain-containing protein [Pontibacter diazotrophicus]|nr:YetF domain-containing protein [Pontibacter diazotrophicus]